MGAGQSDLYKGTDGDREGNLPTEITGSTMPNSDKAITAKEKFMNYSLDYNNPNAVGKAEAYERGLGFNKSNAESLISQIDEAVKSGANSPIEIISSEFGTKYKFRIPVKGINGMIKNVIAVYQIDVGSEIPRLITNFLEGK